MNEYPMLVNQRSIRETLHPLDPVLVLCLT